MQISLKRQSVLGWLTKTNNNKHNNNDKKKLYNVVSVREEFWVRPSGEVRGPACPTQ